MHKPTIDHYKKVVLGQVAEVLSKTGALTKKSFGKKERDIVQKPTRNPCERRRRRNVDGTIDSVQACRRQLPPHPWHS
eukprot:3538891-Amphidinium_carterae.1